MFARLWTAVFPPGEPSALLVVGACPLMTYYFHLVPEDGAIERFGSSAAPATTFRKKGVTEQGREQIGTITLHNGDDEDPFTFFNNVEARVRTLWNDRPKSSPAQAQASSVEQAELVQSILRRAALDMVRDLEGRAPSMNASQTYPVYVLRITRSKGGRLLKNEFTSLG